MQVGKICASKVKFNEGKVKFCQDITWCPPSSDSFSVMVGPNLGRKGSGNGARGGGSGSLTFLPKLGPAIIENDSL